MRIKARYLAKALAMAIVSCSSGLAQPVLAQATTPSAEAIKALPETMEMLRDMIAFPTVEGTPEGTKALPEAAEYLKKRLVSAGFANSDVEIVPFGDSVALVIYYRGSDKSLKPALIRGHMDVVAAGKNGWTTEPFKLTERDGFLYGRGVSDMKTGLVQIVQGFMHLKRQGFVPRREMIMLIAGDEETTEKSFEALSKRFNKSEYMYGVHGASGIRDASGKAIVFPITSGTRGYQDFELKVSGPGGHSSAPVVENNPIYKLAIGLTKISRYKFPVQHNDVTVNWFRVMGSLTKGETGQAMQAFAANTSDKEAIAVLERNPELNGQLRTTCVVTEIEGGHARNALPAGVTANVNCRLFPGTSLESVTQALTSAVADDDVKIRALPLKLGAPMSPPNPELKKLIEKAIHYRYPDVPVIYALSIASSDTDFFASAGVPVYGATGMFSKLGTSHNHGPSENIPKAEVVWGLDYIFRVLPGIGSN